MFQQHDAAGHHAAAAAHHGHAMRHHREASRHYRVGKEYAHAAHQSLVAHGHALRALDSGYAASKVYAEHHGFALPPHRALNGLADPSSSTPKVARDSSEHHDAAASLHDHAGRHHSLAAAQFSTQRYAQAMHDMQLAHGYAQRSLFHGDEAAKHHVEHYGKSAPSAELA